MTLCLALDIGGTKLGAGLVDEIGNISSLMQVPTPVRGERAELFAAVLDLVSQVRHGGGNPPLAACGVGSGGPMDAETISPLNIPGWRGFPLRSELRKTLGMPVFVENDAKALALGERWLGAARGRDNFIAMVVSTGVGAGIVLDGRLLDGRLGNAGHIGHLIVVPDGRQCVCGARGCLEAEASGPAIAAITGRPAPEAPPEIVERTGTLVGRALASVANLCDLELAVVAGGVALGYGEAFFRAAQAELDASARLSFSAGAQVVPAGLGAMGPLIGAAAVAWRGLARHERGPAPEANGPSTV